MMDPHQIQLRDVSGAGNNCFIRALGELVGGDVLDSAIGGHTCTHVRASLARMLYASTPYYQNIKRAFNLFKHSNSEHYIDSLSLEVKACFEKSTNIHEAVGCIEPHIKGTCMLSHLEIGALLTMVRRGFLGKRIEICSLPADVTDDRRTALKLLSDMTRIVDTSPPDITEFAFLVNVGNIHYNYVAHSNGNWFTRNDIDRIIAPVKRVAPRSASSTKAAPSSSSVMRRPLPPSEFRQPTASRRPAGRAGAATTVQPATTAIPVPISRPVSRSKQALTTAKKTNAAVLKLDAAIKREHAAAAEQQLASNAALAKALAEEDLPNTRNNAAIARGLRYAITG